MLQLWAPDERKAGAGTGTASGSLSERRAGNLEGEIVSGCQASNPFDSVYQSVPETMYLHF